ncbi:MAG: hypothetical protein AAFR96_06860 [Planctomycetota bacterium]
MTARPAPRIALATCIDLPEPDPDEDVMLQAARDAGLDVALAAWDDPTIDWTGFDACVVRSTWNYYDDPEAFADWLNLVSDATLLANPAGIVRWNLHKRYLRELEQQGLPIVPTAFVDAGADADLSEIIGNRAWPDDVVIKPCVSAGSSRTRRFRDGCGDEARAFLRSITTADDAMIQPYVPSVEHGGERSAVWIGGEATHAVVKQPRFDADDESVSEAQPVTDAERAMLERCVEIAGDGLLYARLDTMRGPDGSLLISELELIEPSLFLLQSEAATARFVHALRSLAG